MLSFVKENIIDNGLRNYKSQLYKIEHLGIQILNISAALLIVILITVKVLTGYQFSLTHNFPHCYLDSFFLFGGALIVLIANKKHVFKFSKYVGFTFWGIGLFVNTLLNQNTNYNIAISIIFIILVIISTISFSNKKVRLFFYFYFLVLMIITLIEGESFFQDLLITKYQILCFFAFNFCFFVTYQLTNLIIKQENQLKKRTQDLLIEQQLLEKQIQKVNNLGKQKKYLSNVVNGLNAPLALISDTTQNLFSRVPFNKNTKLHLELIQKNANQLLHMNRQVLNALKDNYNKIEIVPTKFKLRELLEELRKNFELTTENKGVQLQSPVYVPDMFIISDGIKLYSILKNILHYIVKNSTTGSKISLNILDIGNHIQIVILNSHINQYSTNSNNHYKPASTKDELEDELTIYREYMELLEGSIQAESTLNIDSTFTITFPKQLQKINYEIIKTFHFNVFSLNKAESISKGHKPRHLLIVEDNFNHCRYLENILGTIYQLSFVDNSKKALEFLKSYHPDLIIYDLTISLIGELGLLKQLKEKSAYSNIPILMLTPKVDLADQLEALKIGINNHLLKPFEADTLLEHISQLLKVSKIPINVSDSSKEKLITLEDSGKREFKGIRTKEKVLNKENKEWLINFEALITNQIENCNLNLDGLAGDMNMSVTHLNRKVKSLVGIPPKRYVQEIRLQKARKLLEEQTYYSVKAVAYSVGFKSTKVFSRNFKARFNKNPSEYFG